METMSHTVMPNFRGRKLNFFFFPFSYTCLGVRMVPGLISHVQNISQVAVWHGEEALVG